MPLATATAIMFLSPVMITALSVPFLGEHVGVRRWVGVAAGLIGALIIIRPGAQEFDERQRSTFSPRRWSTPAISS